MDCRFPGNGCSMLCESESSRAWDDHHPPLLSTNSWDSAMHAQNMFLINGNYSTTNMIQSPLVINLEPMRVERQAQANSHILAERKRRQKLSQKFIALSSLIPGLKKIDKASVLGDAIKHMKQLQERAKILEDELSNNKSMVFVTKYQISSEKENGSNSETTQQLLLPKIEARFCDRDVLIVIHCLKTKGILPKTVAEIEKLHLSVVNSCTMSFGDSTLNLTISAKVNYTN